MLGPVPMRGFSQNVTFILSRRRYERDHPRGERLARRLAEKLAGRGLEPSEVDIWRDGGWTFECAVGGHALEVVLVQNREQVWLLGIWPLKSPNFLIQVFSRRIHPAAPDCARLAQFLDEALRELGAAELRWRWDGHPENSDPERPISLG